MQCGVSLLPSARSARKSRALAYFILMMSRWHKRTTARRRRRRRRRPRLAAPLAVREREGGTEGRSCVSPSTQSELGFRLLLLPRPAVAAAAAADVAPPVRHCNRILCPPAWAGCPSVLYSRSLGSHNGYRSGQRAMI